MIVKKFTKKLINLTKYSNFSNINQNQLEYINDKGSQYYDKYNSVENNGIDMEVLNNKNSTYMIKPNNPILIMWSFVIMLFIGVIIISMPYR